MIQHSNCARYRIRLLELRMKTLELYRKSIFYDYTTRLAIYRLYQEVLLLIKSIKEYNFVERVSIGKTLLVGEGNFSFTCALVKQCSKIPTSLIASTYEKVSELSDSAGYNAELLENIGIKIIYGLDGTKLHESFGANSFDTIIFGFPHSGSREGVDGKNPNYLLVHNFIKSSMQILEKNSVILITIVDNDFYNNMFQFDEISEKLGIPAPIKHKFNPKSYPGYKHSMTNSDESAITQYDEFVTYEFCI